MKDEEFLQLNSIGQSHQVRTAYINYVTGYSDPVWGVKLEVIERSLKYLFDSNTGPFFLFKAIKKATEARAAKVLIPSQLIHLAEDLKKENKSAAREKLAHCVRCDSTGLITLIASDASLENYGAVHSFKCGCSFSIPLSRSIPVARVIPSGFVGYFSDAHLRIEEELKNQASNNTAPAHAQSNDRATGFSGT